jgi:erythromycin esterase
MRTFAAVLLLVVSVSSADARTRAVRSGPAQPPDVGTPAGWLAVNAHILNRVDFPADARDLEPLRTIVGGAAVVGLGDGTHGTHEFYTVKLRMLDFLVRELDFDVVSFEASFAVYERLNAYVHGGAGDPRGVLGEARAVGYYFWDTEEILAVVEWMRTYNAHRGERRAISIAGADIWYPKPAAEAVIAYLRAVDPGAASVAEDDYRCVLVTTGLVANACTIAGPQAAYDRLAARAGDPGSNQRAFEDALQHARVVLQSFSAYNRRDPNMAANVLWLREHRSQSRRVVYWAHSEHVGKTASPHVVTDPAGVVLRNALGSDYVAIGTLTGSGEYRTWTGATAMIRPVLAPVEGTYESYFQQGARPAILIPLRNAPSWLAGPAQYFFAGAAPAAPYLTASLPQKFDAVVYVHATTPIRVLH